MTFPEVALWLLLLLLGVAVAEALSRQVRQRDAQRRAQQERQRALCQTSLWRQKPVTVKPVMGRRPHGVHSAPGPGGGEGTSAGGDGG